MKEIQLTQGKVALVDDEDFEYLNQFKWYAIKNGNTFYAGRSIYVDGKRKNVQMHGVIMNRKGIDHKDHNGLNNQRSNLRFCTNSENQMNKRKRVNTSSIYKGVCFNKREKKWTTRIAVSGEHFSLGYFVSEIEAAKAYNAKAIELFGEFAHLNQLNYT